MAYRYTNTDKWSDCWYSNLKPMEKLLFNYLCDNCDIGGFIELNVKRWATDIVTTNIIIEGALKGLQRGLTYSITGDCLYINNFLKHQKNLPLDPIKNPSHRGIVRRFEQYSMKFGIANIDAFIKGASEGLRRGTGNGNGKGNGLGKEEDTKLSSSNDRLEKYKIKEIYSQNAEVNKAFIEYLTLRPKLKCQNSDRISDRLLKKLKEYAKTPSDAIEIINKAITCGWKDFYPLNDAK